MLHHFESSLAASYKFKHRYIMQSAISLLGIYSKKRKTVKANMSDGVLVNVYQPALQGNKALICAIANYGINTPILAYFKLCVLI